MAETRVRDNAEPVDDRVVGILRHHAGGHDRRHPGRRQFQILGEHPSQQISFRYNAGALTRSIANDDGADIFLPSPPLFIDNPPRARSSQSCVEIEIAKRPTFPETKVSTRKMSPFGSVEDD